MNMRTMILCTTAVLGLIGIVGVWAADEPAPPTFPRFELAAPDVQGQPVAVPAEGKVSIVVYVMVGQERSHEALAHVQRLLAQDAGAQAIAVVSGTNAAARAQRLPELAQWGHPIVADADYRLSDAGQVIAWPTTVIADDAGRRTGHVGGLTSRYAMELASHVAFAAGDIDRAELQRRLAADDPLAGSPHTTAARHLAAAQRLKDQQQLDAAERELREALRLQPRAAQVQLALAQVMLRRGDPDQALAWAQRVDEDSLAPWQVHAVRGRALAALEQWDQARDELVLAVRHNPDPAACYYDLGRAHQHFEQWEQAAKAFRAAYEHRVALPATAEGR